MDTALTYETLKEQLSCSLFNMEMYMPKSHLFDLYSRYHKLAAVEKLISKIVPYPAELLFINPKHGGFTLGQRCFA